MDFTHSVQGAQSLTDVAREILVAMEEENLRPGFSAVLRRGSAAGVVEVVSDPDDPEGGLLTVRMAIMRTPDQATGFYRRLLEVNGKFRGRAAFSLGRDGTVWLLAARPILDLDPAEALDLLVWTANHADLLDDILLDEFGREWSL